MDWSEVWSLLIPAAILLLYRHQPPVNKPVYSYIITALIINITVNLIWKFRLIEYNGQVYNGFLYNVHAIVRFLLFDLYFRKLRIAHFYKIRHSLRPLFIAFVVINFTFYEKFYDYHTPFSSRLLSVEALGLLFLCMQFYISRLSMEEETNIKQPEVWIVTGLSIYVTINFFIFLLYDKLSQQSARFAVDLWNVHNISYIILNLFIAKAFYESGKHRY
ncbi:MAG TPA: hypothetical protein VIM79_27835 [Niastella sp.]